MTQNIFMHPVGATYYKMLSKIADGNVEANEANLFKKALSAGGSTSGAELIPKATSAEVITIVREKNWARQAFPTIVCPTKVFDIPKFTAGMSVYGIDELTSTTAITESSPTTGTISLSQVTLAINTVLTNKIIAYSVAPLVPLIKEEMASAIAAAEEDMMVNGDTETGTAYADNINGAYNASTNIAGVNATNNTHKTLIDTSLRKAAGVSTSAAGAAFAQSHVLNAYKTMGVYGRLHNECIILISPDSEVDVLAWADLQTLEKYGPNATIFTGEIGKVYGSAAIVSDKLPNTASSSLVDNTGVRGGSGNDYTLGLVVWSKSPLIGVPQATDRLLTFRTKEEPEFDRKRLVAVEDIAFNLQHANGVCKIYYIQA